MMISIDKLRRDNLQTRTGLDEETVARYAEALRDQQEAAKHMIGKRPTIGLGKITVYTEDNASYWLADGFHRVEAARRCGIKRIEAQVERGGYLSALRCALGCNAKHGKPTTKEDKRNALRIAWEHRRELFGENDPTASWLASTCCVSKRMAEDFYAEITARCGDLTPQRQNENGRNYTMPQRPVRPAADADGDQPAAPTKAPQRPVYRDKNGGEHCVPLDRYGKEIPTQMQPAFDDEQLAQLVRLISEARCLAAHEREAGNLVFVAMRQDVLMQLNNAYNFAKASAPHCVCIMCQGQGCKECSGKGWQTEEQFDRSCGAHPEFAPEGAQA